jgi:hypothetical protein
MRIVRFAVNLFIYFVCVAVVARCVFLIFFIIFLHSSPLACDFPVCRFSETHWSTEATMREFIEQVVDPYVFCFTLIMLRNLLVL